MSEKEYLGRRLVCNECGGYYELKPSESPSDFNLECKCGGKLQYVETFKKEKIDKHSKRHKTTSEIKISKNFKLMFKKYKKDPINCINKKINLLTVYLGLIISVLFMFIGALIYGVIAAGTKANDMALGFGLILIVMIFLGSLLTGFLSKDYDEGVINGSFLSLVTLINLGLVIGLVWFVSIGIIAAIASAFSGMPSTAGVSSSPTSTTQSPIDTILFFIKIIITIILSFVSGIAGGYLGVVTRKKLFK